MASPKAAKNNVLISNFFKPFTRHALRNDSEIGDNIVVASRPPPPQRLSETPASPAASQTPTPPPAKRGPGRPRKHPVNSDGVKTPRPRGRPRKYPPTSSSPSRSSQSEVSHTPGPSARPIMTASQQQRDDQLVPSSPPSLDARESEQSNIDPLNDKADVSSAEHSPLKPAGDSPSQQPVVPVDENVSSKSTSFTGDMSAPPPPQPQPAEPAEKAANASFSSISTLTSVPKSSQASQLPVSSSTSSRRVISDGLQAVTGSDSESEDLADFATLYSNKRRKLSQDDGVKVVAIASKPPPEKKSSRLSVQQKDRNFFRAYPRSPPKAKPRNSLASLLAAHEKDQISDATIASIESAVEEAKKQDERKKALEDAGYDGEALIAAAGSDSDDRERMIMALARTEALQDKNLYHFFLDTEPSHASSDFPIDSLPDEPWSKIYRNEVSRKEACISGFAAELATRFPLPMPVTSWMACQLQYEPSAELCEAYVEILRASGHDDQSISDTWGSLNSVYKTRSLFEHNWKEHVKTALPSGLAYMVHLVSFRAPRIDSIVSDAPPHNTCAAFLDMTLMNIDELVKGNTSLSMSVADCIENMLDALSEESYSKLIPLAVESLFSPSDLPQFARCRTIASLPASTHRAHKLRRRLALEYFSTAEKRGHDPDDWAKSIVRSLKTKSEFHISERTDYGLLQTLVTVLDIAIDAGWTDYSLLISREPSGPWGERPPPTEIENRHNAQIDAIINALNTMASRIRDAGTSHLRRTETKSLIEQVIARLQYSVRSRPRPQKGVFDGKAGSGMLRQATFNATGFGRKNEEEKVSDREAEEAVDEGDGQRHAVGGAQSRGNEHLPVAGEAS